MFLVALLYFLFASTFIAAKVALAYFPPISFIAIRMMLAGVLILTWLWIKDKYVMRIKRRDYGLFAAMVAFHIYGAYVLEFIALNYMSASKAALLYSLSPFITALLSYFLLSERLRIRQWIALIIGLLGSLPILLGPAPLAELMRGQLFYLSIPEVLLIAAIICSCIGWLIMSMLIKRRSYNPLMINGVSMLGGGILALATGAIFEKDQLIYMLRNKTLLDKVSNSCFFLNEQWPSWLLFLLALTFLILVANIICYGLYAILLKRYSPTFLSFAGFLCPLWATLLDWALCGQIITSAFVISGIIITASLYWFYRLQKNSKKITEPPQI